MIEHTFFNEERNITFCDKSQGKKGVIKKYKLILTIMTAACKKEWTSFKEMNLRGRETNKQTKKWSKQKKRNKERKR